jgi:tRNA uridine 5-carboxymethylaminomethyl modification enzyme
MTGLENVRIMRPGYAIEYDCIDPTQLKLSLEMKQWQNLFCAGQFNGSSGYEEAAAQGLVAGINAVLKLQEKPPFILDRSEAYIGVLIDDLVTKGTNEPYRMMTSRAEYRLVLRQDNADTRLTERSRNLGLASEERYRAMLLKKGQVAAELKRLRETVISPERINPLLEAKDASRVKTGLSLYDTLKRPEISYADLKSVDSERPEGISKSVITQCEVQIKYQGYIDKQLKSVDQFRKMEHRLLPQGIDYHLYRRSSDGSAAEADSAQAPVPWTSLPDFRRFAGGHFRLAGLPGTAATASGEGRDSGMNTRFQQAHQHQLADGLASMGFTVTEFQLASSPSFMTCWWTGTLG